VPWIKATVSIEFGGGGNVPFGLGLLPLFPLLAPPWILIRRRSNKLADTTFCRRTLRKAHIPKSRHTICIRNCAKWICTKVGDSLAQYRGWRKTEFRFPQTQTKCNDIHLPFEIARLHPYSGRVYILVYFVRFFLKNLSLCECTRECERIQHAKQG
jgi:hypothetical protein